MTYAGEGPIGFLGNNAEGQAYNATNQWGGKSAPRHEGGQWVLGCRAKQAVVGVNVMSNDGGKSLAGKMTYSGEGPIGFKGTLIAANTSFVENQWGGNDAPWYPRGQWVIGRRGAQHVIALQAEASASSGGNLSGVMTYNGEGPIGLTLTRSS